jgi:hypothetical protein
MVVNAEICIKNLSIRDSQNFKISMGRGGLPMSFEEKTFKQYCWDNMSAFRRDIKEYLKSISLMYEPKRHTYRYQSKNLSLSENSGYNYSPIHQVFTLVDTLTKPRLPSDNQRERSLCLYGGSLPFGWCFRSQIDGSPFLLKKPNVVVNN